MFFEESVMSPIRLQHVQDDPEPHLFLLIMISYGQCVLGVGVRPIHAVVDSDCLTKNIVLPRQAEAVQMAN